MSKKDIAPSDGDDRNAKLELIRTRIEQADSIDLRFDDLLSALLIHDQGATTIRHGEDMLDLLVSEVLRGVDIETQFPDAFAALQADEELRTIFYDVLDSITAESEGQTVPLPKKASPSLAFLDDLSAPAQISEIEERVWHIEWARSVEQIQAIISPQELVYRRSRGIFSDESINLLRDEIEIADWVLTVLLDIEMDTKSDENLHARLSLALSSQQKGKAIEGAHIEAKLQWGGYGETVNVEGEGILQLTPILISQISDPQKNHIVEGLTLDLQTRLPA